MRTVFRSSSPIRLPNLLPLFLLLAACGAPAPEENNEVLPDEIGSESYAVEVNKGWDYGMYRRCVKTTDGATNHFEVTTDCIPGSNAHWLIANQAEIDAGVSCQAGGDNDRSYPITYPPTGTPPVWFQLIPNGSKWIYELKLDHVNNALACNSPNAFHYYSIYEHRDHGGVLPNMDSMHTSHTLWYNDWVPNGATRQIVAAEFSYYNLGAKRSSDHIIEINTVSTNWVDGHPTPEVISYVSDFTNGQQYITLDGASFGLTLSKNQSKNLVIEWHEILAWVISHGYFSPINYSKPRSTKSVYTAIEMKNSAVVHLQTSDFKLAEGHP